MVDINYFKFGFDSNYEWLRWLDEERERGESYGGGCRWVLGEERHVLHTQTWMYFGRWKMVEL